ncbi:hypothetical protein XELAEV_18009840mg [Xenopus laevis]|uniref:GIY-YIG domain-containing protein n=1 Tax=Xenopus laevis TaxID=8355 RepID=A0A974I174_XENLA|nr:hypothetical protein XELAEV_18009840mg [Xenopus laevis]
MEKIFKGKPNLGTFPCLGCVCCSSIIKGVVVQHPTKGNRIPLRHYATCNTQWVVYMLKCPCGKVYVGQSSREVKAIIKEHRGDIKNFKLNTYTDTSVSRHCNECRHNMSQLKWQVLEVVQTPQRGGNKKNILLQKEALWIKKLCAMVPQGLNDQWIVVSYL